MSEIVIKIENLSKEYRLGQVGTGTISHDLNRWWYKLRGKEDPYLKLGETNDRAHKGESDYVYALKDINIEVKKGEVLGIIGKNGAGKSTLLKILSKVTGPTTGSIKSKGRIASLLEVGTGFHPELTGRENIYMNGTIMGMTRKKIDEKLDEIIEFAGINRYIDTPTKRYSSGMTVRLGFAIAAHLEPEILVVDEVLAVGDAEFQKKAIGKMQEVSENSGRTVLFVSHNMGSMRKLCTRGILLKNGMNHYSGKIEDIIKLYEAPLFDDNIFKSFRISELDLKVNKIEITSKRGKTILPKDTVYVNIEIKANREVNGIGIEVFISQKESNQRLFVTNTKTRNNMDVTLKAGLNKIELIIPSLSICSGEYRLGFGIDEPMTKWFYYEENLLCFEVSKSRLENCIVETDSEFGLVYFDHSWNIS